MAAPNGSHTRSISLPSRSHPSTATVEELLYTLKSSEASSTSLTCNKLSDLEALFDSVEEMLQLPLIQQSLSKKHNEKCVEEVVDGSLEILEVCGATKDIFSQIKGCVQDVESSLRRRKGGESGLVYEVRQFLISQKKANKKVSECLRSLRRMEKKHSSTALLGDEAIANILREVVKINLSVFESLLLSVSQQNTISGGLGSWSLVSKLMRPKRVACENGDVNEMEKVIAALHSFTSQKLSIEKVQALLKPLEALESSIVELEDGLESVFRRLVKNRVSLLNILSQ